MKHGDTKEFGVEEGGIYEIEFISHEAHSSLTAIAVFAFLDDKGGVLRHECACFQFSERYAGYYKYIYIKRSPETTLFGPILAPPGCVKIRVSAFDHPKNTGAISFKLSVIEAALKAGHAATLSTKGEAAIFNFLSALPERHLKGIDKQFVYELVNSHGLTEHQGLAGILLEKFGPQFYFDPYVYLNFTRLKDELEAGLLLENCLESDATIVDPAALNGTGHLAISTVSADEAYAITDIRGKRFVFLLADHNGNETNLAEALENYASNEVNTVDTRQMGMLKAMEFLAAVVFGYLHSCGMGAVPLCVTNNDSPSRVLAHFLVQDMKSREALNAL